MSKARAQWRFAAFCVVLGDCIIWTGSKHAKGYGHFWMNGKRVKAHRAARELFLDEKLPSNVPVMHTGCDAEGNTYKDCINPDHTAPGTVLQNNQAVNAKRRQAR